MRLSFEWAGIGALHCSLEGTMAQSTQIGPVYSSRRLPMIALLAHTLIVLAVAMVVYSDESGEVHMFWLGFLALDFPAGLLAIPAEQYLEPLINPTGSPTVAFVVFPAVTFAVLGGLQYYCMGWGICRIAHLLRRRHRRARSCCVECGYQLHRHISSTCPECGASCSETMSAGTGSTDS